MNLQAVYQTVFNSVEANKAKLTEEQKTLAKRVSGTISVSLPSCYTVKTK